MLPYLGLKKNSLTIKYVGRMRGASLPHEQRGRMFRVFLSDKDCKFNYYLGYVPILVEPSKTRVLLGNQKK